MFRKGASAQTELLIRALLFSGALNIVLLGTLSFWAFKEWYPYALYQVTPFWLTEESFFADEKSNEEVIQYYAGLPFEQLVAKLHAPRLVEDGYSQRDLSLACLVNFHDFDLQRALSVKMEQMQKRTITLQGKEALVVFPGLQDEQYAKIIYFAETEKFPFTAKGLFERLKKGGTQEGLLEAFLHTPECIAFEQLLQHTATGASPQDLVKMLLEGTYEEIAHFYAKQKLKPDYSKQVLRTLLLDYLEHRSKTAAYLLVKMEYEFAQKKLDDRHVISILVLMDEYTEEYSRFALDLLKSPRSDVVWHLAARKLYEFSGKPVPQDMNHIAALAQFSQQNSMAEMGSRKKVKLEETPKEDKVYVVQNGDTLWGIARMIHVDVELLKKRNNLATNTLRAGTLLHLP